MHLSFIFPEIIEWWPNSQVLTESWPYTEYAGNCYGYAENERGYKKIPGLHSPQLLNPQEAIREHTYTPQSEKKQKKEGWAEGRAARASALWPCRPPCSHGSEGGEMLRVWLVSEAVHHVQRAPTGCHRAPRSMLLPKCTLNFPPLFTTTAPIRSWPRAPLLGQCTRTLTALPASVLCPSSLGSVHSLLWGPPSKQDLVAWSFWTQIWPHYHMLNSPLGLPIFLLNPALWSHSSPLQPILPHSPSPRLPPFSHTGLYVAPWSTTSALGPLRRPLSPKSLALTLFFSTLLTPTSYSISQLECHLLGELGLD